jgi:preprotein translocase subunit YajC
MLISLAHAQTAAQPSGGESLIGLLPIIAMFVILYFLMIRPQMKRAKEHKTMVDALQVGDEVVALGILGRIRKIGDTYVALEVANNTTLHLEKQTVNKLLPKGTIKDFQI